jgi:hypothetical protein
MVEFISTNKSWVWWYTPVIPESMNRRITVMASSGKKVRPYL